MNEHRAHAPHIAFTGLKLGYPGKVVIESLEGELPAGQISVILGGSGCGKSTLLRHVLGLATPIGGQILVDGKDLTRLTKDEAKQLKRNMGVLFQDGALLGSLTLGENVALPMMEHSDLEEDIIEDVVRMKLRLVGLEPFLHYYPSQLSGGMRKRAGLARAMVMDPGVLMCDEPSAGLDPITAADLDQLILLLKETFNMTIVVVTHDLDSLKTIADHVIVLHEGKDLYQGDLSGLLNCQNPYIQDFLQRKPRNGSGL
jgi:phospholipid/cholesterol/gamma-HCH transport system ATP-binding protein